MTKVHTLKEQQELRLEISFEETVKVQLMTGTAEVFGCELLERKEYTFTGCKVPIFTWHGCTITITGECTNYIGEGVEMFKYLNTHTALENIRKKARENTNLNGPRVLITGPPSCGKNSLSRILLNYAIRMGNSPLFVDLDPNQNEIGVPGTINVMPMNKPIYPNEGYSLASPLSYFFGSINCSDNLDYYKILCQKLAQSIDERVELDEAARTSGIVVNTIGCIEKSGLDLLKFIIKTFGIEYVIVIGDERLSNMLSNLTLEPKKIKKEEEIKNEKEEENEIKTEKEEEKEGEKEKETKEIIEPKKVQIIQLKKSGGVVVIDEKERKTIRKILYKRYFYGITQNLKPSSMSTSWDGLGLFKIKYLEQAPEGALPFGKRSKLDPINVKRISPSSKLDFHIGAISFAKSTKKEDLLTTNIAGFIRITKVDEKRRRITYISPSSRTLPSQIIIFGQLTWYSD
ncbi:polyribonucleotide 5'-hydroxyl-kinase clp1 [Anaeramoeba flamelloides]|uniref:Protein CLP1 homolog n=1 Tax=Anaeramoeba flamelloides TaxID=1746091 RepID=A0AAV7Z3D3_9EUKA|nr:polyribonucleotide 5'-hydroxyl-kinase clp1 [Anaeramoeba flamelloides]